MVENFMEENIFCFLSEVGHNNFYYPTNQKAVLKVNAPYTRMCWISIDRQLCAIKVKNEHILRFTYADNENINKDRYSIVWINKDKLSTTHKL